ncbi:MAG: nucleotidyltransferase domain-containing protein [DPANN group archaeon]|nr:nucleotidyltransferase domain-containing protein [DPANN group archaeon]
MPLPSKEEQILELFLNEPSKHWHFKDIIATAKISEPSASKWLRKLEKRHIIRRSKPEGKMPYFQARWDHPDYDSRKRIYALTKLHETGLLNRLQTLRKAKTVVIFGSWYRGDWNTKSDVDVFIYGDPEGLRFGMLWKGLGFQGKAREIQVHSFGSKEKIRDIHSGLMKNVVKGYFVKGDIHDIAEVET